MEGEFHKDSIDKTLSEIMGILLEDRNLFHPQEEGGDEELQKTIDKLIEESTIKSMKVGREESVIEKDVDPTLDYGMPFIAPELRRASKEECHKEMSDYFFKLKERREKELLEDERRHQFILARVSPEKEVKECVDECFFKTDSQTAYKESEGKLFFELDWDFIKQMAERMASNKKEGKYSLWNWKKSMTPKGIEDLKQASMRHLLEIMEGRYEDDGREFGHLEALSDNMMMINYQLKNNV